MSDIFLSYAVQDLERASTLAKAFEATGWSVWWNRRIPAGDHYTEVIEQALDEARAVVVLWTKKSVASDWIRMEASEAVDRGILLPVILDDVKVPLAFRRIQALDLRGWEGEADSAELRVLEHDLVTILGQPPATVERIMHGGPSRERSGADQEATSPLVFVCYSRSDEEFTLKLAQSLKDRGIRIWLDQWELSGSEDWDRAIDDALYEACDQILIVMSPEAVASDNVRGELQVGFNLRKPIVPVLFQDCRIPRRLLLKMNCDFRSSDPTDASNVEEVVRAITGGQ